MFIHRWWREYAARKNDEEEEHVADSLLYDERCHLPRTTGPPVFKNPQALSEEEASQAAPQGQSGSAPGAPAAPKASS